MMNVEKDYGFYHETRLLDANGKPRTLKVPVVQELARQGLNDLPDRFRRLHPHNSISTSSSASQVFEEVPSIDLAKLRYGSEQEGRAEELAKLANAARNLGLFFITDHSIPFEVLSGVKHVVKGFFDLSFQEKKASVGTYADTDNMGYGRNFVKSEDQPLDWIDRLTMRAAPVGADQGLHVWPQKPANFREAMVGYVAEARGILDHLLVALAEALSLEEHDVFLRYFDPKDSEIKVRVNYYPPCPRPDLALGLNQHSDLSALSILMQFGSNEGLQVLKDQNWFTVTWPQGQLLVIVGDLLEIMSNGLIQSTWHRAIIQRDMERGSIALFYSPPARTQIEPIADAASNGKRYKKVVVEDYVRHYSKTCPTVDKIAINFAKVNASK